MLCNFSLHIYEISGYQSIFSDLETFFVQKYDQNQIYKNAILGTVVKLQIEINAHKNAHRAHEKHDFFLKKVFSNFSLYIYENSE